MITFKSLINKVDFELVWKEFLTFYPDLSYRRDKYSQIYKFLLSKEPEDNIDVMVIHIDRQDYEDFTNKEDCRLELKETEIVDIGYRVHGRSNSAEWSGYWDISPEKWGNWLGYFIHDKLLEFLTIEKITALCLYEMTWHGFSENEVIAWASNLVEAVKE